MTLKQFTKVVGYATAIFMNDPVARVSGGNLQVLTTPGTTLWTGVSLDYSAPSTAFTHTVVVSLDAIYEMQTQGTGLVATQMGLNANIIATQAGSTLTRQSGYCIDDGTTTAPAVTSTLDLHLLNLWGSPDNAFGPYARIEVMLNKSRFGGSTAGV